MGLFYEPVNGLLGIVLLAIFIVCVIAFSAGITWIVVKVSPAKGTRRQPTDGSAPTG